MNLLKKPHLDFIKNNFLNQKAILIVLLLIYILLVILFKPSCQFFIKHLNNKFIIFPFLISIIWLSQDNFLLGVCLVVAFLVTLNLQKIEKFTDKSDGKDESVEDKNDEDEEQEEDETEDKNENKDEDEDKDKGKETQIKLLKLEINQKNSKIQDLNQQLENEKNKPFSDHATKFFYENAEKFMNSDIYKDKDHLFSKFIEMFEKNIDEHKSNSIDSIEPFVGFNYIH